MRNIDYQELKSLFKIHGSEGKHKIFLRMAASGKMQKQLSVLDCFGGEGLLCSFWHKRCEHLTIIEKNATRFHDLEKRFWKKADLVRDNSLKWIKEQNYLNGYNVFELDTSGIPNNWIKVILDKKLTGQKLFAVTDTGKLNFRTRGQLNPALFDWSTNKPIVRNLGRDLYANYLYVVRDWWQRLSEKHGFRIQFWRYHECAHPKTALYYAVVVDFGQ